RRLLMQQSPWSPWCSGNVEYAVALRIADMPLDAVPGQSQKARGIPHRGIVFGSGVLREQVLQAFAADEGGMQAVEDIQVHLVLGTQFLESHRVAVSRNDAGTAAGNRKQGYEAIQQAANKATRPPVDVRPASVGDEAASHQHVVILE